MERLSVQPESQAVAAFCTAVRAAQTPAEMAFLAANRVRELAPYRTALVLLGAQDSMRVVCASGLAQIDRQAPFTQWVEAMACHLVGSAGERHLFMAQDLPPQLRPTWAEFWPTAIHAYRLQDAQGQVLGLALYVPEVPWPASLAVAMSAIHALMGACLERAPRRRTLSMSSWRAWRWTGAVVVLAALAVLPVRQFVIAPAEIVSTDTLAVTPPVDGIVASLAVKPNQPVRKGDELLRLDDTTVRNRLESARQSLSVARADYLTAAHRSFQDSERSSELAVLQGRIRERVADVAYLEEQLELMVVRAPRDGVAVYGQENDWIGKPVSAGLRIMDVADDQALGLVVWLPVGDAIAVQASAPFRVLMHVDPLHPRAAVLESTSYQPLRSPDGVVAYRIVARLEDAQGLRLGLRGSAKLDGEQVALAYLLLRRPIMAVRQWLGL